MSTIRYLAVILAPCVPAESIGPVRPCKKVRRLEDVSRETMSFPTQTALEHQIEQQWVVALNLGDNGGRFRVEQAEAGCDILAEVLGQMAN